jgi:hypothetical protein
MAHLCASRRRDLQPLSLSRVPYHPIDPSRRRSSRTRRINQFRRHLSQWSPRSRNLRDSRAPSPLSSRVLQSSLARTKPQSKLTKLYDHSRNRPYRKSASRPLLHARSGLTRPRMTGIPRSGPKCRTTIKVAPTELASKASQSNGRAAQMDSAPP